ncbi:MAG: DUF3224 domain-containing protein [Kutzneria sp.]|nr:DUF3224 domain-containing protein [Kutzneria sp.]
MNYSHRASCRFTVASWSESVVSDIDDSGTTIGGTYYPMRGLTRAEVRYSYTGDLAGSGTLVYLIGYKADAAPVLGFERFEGTVAGREGTCVFRHVGTQDKGSVSAQIDVVPGMGTGGLENLRGEAELCIAGQSDDGYPLTLCFDVE